MPPTPEEVRTIIELAQGRNPDVAPLITLADLTGARLGSATHSPCVPMYDDPSPDLSPLEWFSYVERFGAYGHPRRTANA